jgi:BNR repeat protein
MTLASQSVDGNRRRFLKAMAAATVGPSIVGLVQPSAAGAPSETESLIQSITPTIAEEGRNRAENWAWFHPRACLVPRSGGPPVALMTIQSIGGSDYFGPVHWSTSADNGKTWSEFMPIPGLDRHPTGESDMLMGVCDVSPDYHAASNTTLAMGHNVYYQGGRLARPQGPRWPVYTVWNADGTWAKPKKLEWNDPRGSRIYTSGCGQRIMLPDGDVLIPLSFGNAEWKQRRATAALCEFDGHTLNIKRVGNELTIEAGRGLLEPSLVEFKGRYYMTIRAEDDRGYVSSSDDGLQWSPKKAWVWDDGRPLVMSTTQQHWLAHHERLYLVYTRKAKENVNVMRWRAPLYMAQVDTESQRLVRSSERIVLPMRGDGVNDAKNVARMGNFHVTDASPNESWVTAGECLPANDWRGDVLLSRIRWRRPNRRVASGG